MDYNEINQIGLTELINLIFYGITDILQGGIFMSREGNSVIRIENITKDYGNQKGVFNISFEVRKGEVMGFLGPNGA